MPIEKGAKALLALPRNDGEGYGKMEYLSRLFVQQPLSARGISTLLGAVWLGLLVFRKIGVKGFWMAGLAWLAYAAWERWVLSSTPEANIRIDLLIIIPLLAIWTLWGIWQSLLILFRA